MGNDCPMPAGGLWTLVPQTYVVAWSKRGTVNGPPTKPSPNKLARYHRQLRDLVDTGTCREERRRGGGDYGHVWDLHRPGRDTREGPWVRNAQARAPMPTDAFVLPPKMRPCILTSKEIPPAELHRRNQYFGSSSTTPLLTSQLRRHPRGTRRI